MDENRTLEVPLQAVLDLLRRPDCMTIVDICRRYVGVLRFNFSKLVGERLQVSDVNLTPERFSVEMFIALEGFTRSENDHQMFAWPVLLRNLGTMKVPNASIFAEEVFRINRERREAAGKNKMRKSYGR